MDWSEVTRRVVIEAAAPHPEDRVLVLGPEWAVARALAERVDRVVVRAGGAEAPDLPGNVGVDAEPWSARPPEGTSVVVLHDGLAQLEPAAQRALLTALGAALPPRALLVVGGVMWSLPHEQIDEPEQFGVAPHAPTVRAFEALVREAGFLPDTHRFGVGRAVCVALRA